MDMDIFVISRSRYHRSTTLEALDNLHIKEMKERVRLVVPRDQYKSYKPMANRHRCLLLDCPSEGIALTREWCGAWTNAKGFLMLDDDLTFFRRLSPTSTSLVKPRKVNLDDSIDRMIGWISDKLVHYAHCSISAREGNNRLEYPGVECSRPLRALAYQTKLFNELEHGRVDIMEDFDITLQLLRLGYPNYVLSSWAQDQKGTQVTGGCSDYRTKELHEENVRKLAILHPGFVKTRQKHNKTGGEFGNRLEATIYWKKAFDSSKAVKAKGKL